METKRSNCDLALVALFLLFADEHRTQPWWLLRDLSVIAFLAWHLWSGPHSQPAALLNRHRFMALLFATGLAAKGLSGQTEDFALAAAISSGCAALYAGYYRLKSTSLLPHGKR